MSGNKKLQKGSPCDVYQILGQVAGVITATKAPKVLNVIWAFPLGTNPETYDLRIYKGGSWQPITGSSFPFWLTFTDEDENALSADVVQDSLLIKGAGGITVTVDQETKTITITGGGGSGGVAWGAITGTLADQTDLQAALDALDDAITDLEADVVDIEVDIADIQADYVKADDDFDTAGRVVVVDSSGRKVVQGDKLLADLVDDATLQAELLERDDRLDDLEADMLLVESDIEDLQALKIGDVYQFTLDAPVQDEVLVVCAAMPGVGTIDSIKAKTDTGTMDLRLSLDAVAVNTGVTSITDSYSSDTMASTNSYTLGQVLTMTLSNFADSPTQIIVGIKVTQNLQAP